MKKIISTALFVALSAIPAHAADTVTLQLKWVTQAQFAGYFVAADKVFYKDEGLEVNILQVVLMWRRLKLSPAVVPMW